jgi:hypothetical protein
VAQGTRGVNVKMRECGNAIVKMCQLNLDPQLSTLNPQLSPIGLTKIIVIPAKAFDFCNVIISILMDSRILDLFLKENSAWEDMISGKEGKYP